jgi:hypothetical protein
MHQNPKDRFMAGLSPQSLTAVGRESPQAVSSWYRLVAVFGERRLSGAKLSHRSSLNVLPLRRTKAASMPFSDDIARAGPIA